MSIELKGETPSDIWLNGESIGFDGKAETSLSLPILQRLSAFNELKLVFSESAGLAECNHTPTLANFAEVSLQIAE